MMCSAARSLAWRWRCCWRRFACCTRCSGLAASPWPAIPCGACSGRALTLGLLTTLALALAVLPLAGILVASVVGVPVLLALLALALALYIYGLVVLARSLSLRGAQPATNRRMAALRCWRWCC